MKTTAMSLLLLSLLGTEARAERYIVKNPRIEILNAQAIKSFDFGRDHFVVIEAPRFSALEASLAANAESVVPDMKIGVPKEQPADWWKPKPKTAWHVKAMKYDQLPSDRDGKGVVVAVIDTGVDYNHPALKDHMWVNPGEIADNGIDDDGNGYVDDIYGYDFEGNDSNPMDGDEHGTHCAGVIAASTDPQSGARGVAQGAKVMAVRIIGSEQTGFISDAVEGIKYAVDNGATVLSNSWRVYRSWSSYNPSDENVELLRKAIDYAGSKGVIFVAAAGNESKNLDTSLKEDPMWPGGYEGLPNLVVVAASDENNKMASFSNFGAGHVMVAAPGTDIISTVPGNKWRGMSGTSMASPLVAGSLARGLSASYDFTRAISHMVETSTPMDNWKSRAKAGGVIELSEYLK